MSKLKTEIKMNLMLFIRCQSLISVLFIVAHNIKESVASNEENYKEECSVWNGVVQYLEQKDVFDISCGVNPQCTGFDCNGLYKFNVSAFPMFNVSLCFGMFLHPCASTNGTVSVYTELVEPDHADFGKTFTKSEQVHVNGTHFQLSGLSFDGFINVTDVPMEIDGKKYLLLGMDYRIRTSLLGFSSWPDKFKFVLVPDVKVPVPRCDESVKTKEHKKGTCNPYRPPYDAIPSIPFHKPDKPIKPEFSRASTGVKCSADLFGECDDHQTCEDSVCVCFDGFEYAKIQNRCIEVNVTTTSIPTFIAEEIADSKINLVLYVAVPIATIGGLAIVIIAVVCAFKYKQYKAQYGSHTPLMNNDDDDDDPMEVA